MHVHHLAFRTHDVARLTAFYRDVVGLTATECPTEGNAWLLAGETILMIEHRADGEPDVPAGSMDLVAFAIPSGERFTFEARLMTASVVIEGRTSFSVYFRDPDGRRVGVSHFPLHG